MLGYYGGQIASFEAFSPKGPDGRPMPIFDRDTGRIDPAVQKAWEKYDISRILRANWKTLGPKLRGKLHVFCGTADTFHLDEALRLLDVELKKLGSNARIEFLEGRTHFDLYKDGLSERIAKEMYAVARPKAKCRSPHVSKGAILTVVLCERCAFKCGRVAHTTAAESAALQPERVYETD